MSVPILKELLGRCDFNPKTGCHIWICNRKHSPQLESKGVWYNLRRLAYLQYYNEQPPAFVISTCRNPLCIEPTHLIGVATREELAAYATKFQSRLPKIPKITREFIREKTLDGYGIRRITRMLAERGTFISHTSVRRIRDQYGVKCKRREKWDREVIKEIRSMYLKDTPRRAILKGIKARFNVSMTIHQLAWIKRKYKLKRKPS